MTARAVKGIERRLHTVTTCISFPQIDSDDDVTSDDDVNDVMETDNTSHYSISSDEINGGAPHVIHDEKSPSRRRPVDGSYELRQKLQDDEIRNKPDGVRKHLPPGSGPHSVGCVDVMDDDGDDGTFFRLFYPTEKTDIYVSATVSLCVL